MSDNGNQESSAVFESVMSFFEQDAWDFEREEGETLLKMDYEGENGKWSCLAQVVEERDRFLFFSILPHFVPSNMRLEACEYLNRANYGMEIGSFEMDMADGELRFRTSVDYEGGELTETMIKNMVYTNIAVFDQYLPGLRKVVIDGMEPGKAIQEVEGSEESSAEG